MKNGKYFIVLFCNKKRDKIFFRSQKQNTIYQYWKEIKLVKKPKFIKIHGKKRNLELVYELGLIFPNNRWSKAQYVKDSLGRNIEAKMENDKFRIKKMIPYWKEEVIYDFELKKHIKFDELIEKTVVINEISQIFTLNNKLFVQIGSEIIMYGNKNIEDSERLFDLVREELLLIRKKGNFIFVKDINTRQRKNLYVLLEKKGFKRTELFRHYSY